MSGKFVERMLKLLYLPLSLQTLSINSTKKQDKLLIEKEVRIHYFFGWNVISHDFRLEIDGENVFFFFKLIYYNIIAVDKIPHFFN